MFNNSKIPKLKIGIVFEKEDWIKKDILRISKDSRRNFYGNWVVKKSNFYQSFSFKERAELIKNPQSFLLNNIFGNENFKINYMPILVRNKENYETRWNEIWDKYMLILLSYFKLEKPRFKEIHSWISFSPVSPRYLDSWSFPIFFDRPLRSQIFIASHEIFHFFWFQKFTELFPEFEHNGIDYSSPNLIWHLSEIMATVTLSSEQVFLQIYNEGELKVARNQMSKPHKEARIGNLNFIEYFRRLYFKYYTSTEEKDIELFFKISFIKIFKYKDNLDKYYGNDVGISYKISNYMNLFRNDDNLSKYFEEY